MKLDDVVKRCFTTEGTKVKDMFQWEERSSHLKDYKTGETIFKADDLLFPIGYSQNAVDIIASRYFRKKGVEGHPEGREHSLYQVAHRMVNFWALSLMDEDMLSKEQAVIFYDEVMYMILSQMFAPNSPQWFNTGLALSYGITGDPAGHWHWDEEVQDVIRSKDKYTRTQASACFILEIEDSLLGPGSITDNLTTETILFKGGSGVGTNYSNLRATGEKLSGGGNSSGLMSFLKIFDTNAGSIKSGGESRRSARMVVVDADHPEVLDVIKWKSIEEDKVEALVKMGYDGSIAGEAYETVSGQNSNNSIRFNHDLMEKIEAGEFDAPHHLRGRVDPSVDRDITVGELWEEFNRAAWRCADPAPQFHDTMNEWHTCPGGENGDVHSRKNQINASNPCSEYLFLDNTSCNLGSLNLLKFLFRDNSFNLEGYLQAITMAQLVLEASIHWGQFPTPEIARRTEHFRTTGLGVTNLGGLLLSLGLPYDSNDGRDVAAGLMSLLTGRSYYVSALMAKEIGAFKYYQINKNSMLRVIRNHRVASGHPTYTQFEGVRNAYIPRGSDALAKLGWYEVAKEIYNHWDLAILLGEEYGYRNAQVSVAAPCGTIGFAMDNETTSIEPFFGHMVFKKVVDGSYMTLANPLIPRALRSLGYTEPVIDSIVSQMETESLEKIPEIKPEHLGVFDTAMRNPGGTRFLSPMAHVKMVAALTPNVSGAISKTVNLPSDATVDDFKEVTLEAWKLGVKCISLYRDGSKAAQPLNVSLDQKVESKDLSKLSYAQLLKYAEDKTQQGEFINRRQKLEGVRKGTTHFAQIEDVKIYVTVNRDDENKIREIFLTTDRSGTLITGLLNSLTKTISTMLQYNIHPKDISRMLRGQKYEPHGFVRRHPNIKNCSSISDLISKIIDIEIGDYSRVQVKPEDTVPKAVTDFSLQKEPEGERIYGEICSNCSGDRLINNGTCKVCLDCGETTGCS